MPDGLVVAAYSSVKVGGMYQISLVLGKLGSCLSGAQRHRFSERRHR